MNNVTRKIAVLGSTGSIGCSTLNVIAHSHGKLAVFALAAQSSCAAILAQAQATNPRYVVITDAAAAAAFSWQDLPSGTELLVGNEGLLQIVEHAEVDVVVAAIVGSAGLTSAWGALNAGKTLALANKETLVMAGPLVMQLAQQKGCSILPIDSEHSALLQCLQGSKLSEVQRMILTASGGPFRNHTLQQLKQVTVAEALAHPTWQMGQKITVDSATMMNKALEIIEARWLFNLPPEKIEVVIHPQSIVHSLVEFIDGSIITQLSPPDMQLPIQYALTWPERWECPTPKFNWRAAHTLEFFPPDEERFPALALGHEVARQGGTAGAVLNAANEAAVARFLAGNMRYHEIVPACQAVLRTHNFEERPTLARLIDLDRWARQEIMRWKS